MYESFDDYLEYLDKIKGSIPSHVYEFASDENRHNLDSPHSLHDSWVTSITVKEKRNKEHPFEPITSLELELLGQMHDRDIVLEYRAVEYYRLEGIGNPYNSGDTFHGDIACHEVTLNDSGLLVHEILMVSEAVIKVVFKNFKCSERVYT